MKNDRSLNTSNLDDFVALREYNNSRSDMLRHQLALNRIDEKKLMRYKHFINHLEKYKSLAFLNSDECFELKHAFVKWKLTKL